MTVRRGAESAVVAGCSQVFLLDHGCGPGFLGALVPDAVYLLLGADGEGGAAIDPWDVSDAADVAESKIAFLMRLHALLIGEHERGTDPLGLGPLERELLEIAVRAVYARAAAGAGRPSERLLRAVLGELASREREQPGGGEPLRAATYDALAARLGDVCAGGRFGHLLDEPTRVDARDAPLVVLDTSLVPEDVEAAVMLAIVDYVSGLIERSPSRRISLLVDAVDAPALRGGDRYSPVFPDGSPLNGLHETFHRRRVRGGEAGAIAYLHAISDVAHFLHPPPALSDPV